MSVDLWVLHHGKFEVLLAVDVLDARLREPVARFLEKHKGKTITELGNLAWTSSELNQAGYFPDSIACFSTVFISAEG